MYDTSISMSYRNYETNIQNGTGLSLNLALLLVSLTIAYVSPPGYFTQTFISQLREVSDCRLSLWGFGNNLFALCFSYLWIETEILLGKSRWLINISCPFSYWLQNTQWSQCSHLKTASIPSHDCNRKEGSATQAKQHWWTLWPTVDKEYK